MKNKNNSKKQFSVKIWPISKINRIKKFSKLSYYSCLFSYLIIYYYYSYLKQNYEF